MSFQPIRLSPRLAEIVDALPIRPGMRVLEIGGAPGIAARAIVERIPEVHVLVIDRSEKGVAQMERLAAAEVAAERMSVRCIPAEEFELAPGEAPYDLAFAIRVGALDGRHPRAGEQVRDRMSAALVKGGKLLVDGGDPLREFALN